MTFSPATGSAICEAADELSAGPQRSAMIPMLLYAQDEIGYVTHELIEEVRQALWRHAAAGG